MVGRIGSVLALLSRILPAIAALCVLATGGTVSAQEYEFDGALELRAVGAYRKDSVVVADPEERGEWTVSGLTQFEATHLLSGERVRVFVDHALIGTAPTDATASDGDGLETGTAGTGGADSTTIELSHELYRAYVGLPLHPGVEFRLGRQRFDWGLGSTFSATDALHPQSSDNDERPGFDGAAASLTIHPAVSLRLAAALQNAVDTGDIDDVRYAAYGTARVASVDTIASVVYQDRTMLRPGAGLGIPIGPIRAYGEVAVEAYDPRGERLDTQIIGSIGAEYVRSADRADVSIATEYLYNGLEEHYPGIASSSLLVTSDFAGGFTRPDRHYAAATIYARFTDSWSTEHSALFNLVDESGIFEHHVTFLGIPIVDVSVAVTWNRGVADSEFGLIRDGMVVELGARTRF